MRKRREKKEKSLHYTNRFPVRDHRSMQFSIPFPLCNQNRPVLGQTCGPLFYFILFFLLSNTLLIIKRLNFLFSSLPVLFGKAVIGHLSVKDVDNVTFVDYELLRISHWRTWYCYQQNMIEKYRKNIILSLLSAIFVSKNYIYLSIQCVITKWKWEIEDSFRRS